MPGQSAPSSQPPWLRGPVEGVPAMLQPVAHALIDADEDVRKVVPPLSTTQIAMRPGGAASLVYHVRHAMGSLDRLFTYARGESLSDFQIHALAGEKTLDPTLYTAIQLADDFSLAIEKAHAQLRATSAEELGVTRLVGRARLPATTLGLLFHAAEHTARHVGQIVTTAKIVAAP